MNNQNFLSQGNRSPPMRGGNVVPMAAMELPAELVQNCRVVSTRDAILPLLPKQKVFCEIGVALGDFSKNILATCDVSRFYAIDLFLLHNHPDMWHGLIGEVLGSAQHLEYYRQKFEPYCESGIMHILIGDSADMIASLPEQSVDIFYVDSNHSYAHIKRELSIIKTRTAPGAWIILDDYIMVDWITNTTYGVVQAVNEFMIQERWEMVYFALNNEMFCNVAIRKL